MAGNRAVVYQGPRKVEVQSIDYPKLIAPNGKKCNHGVIVKLVSTNICGSDLHMYRRGTRAPKGTVFGHEIAGEVIETSSDVEYIKAGLRSVISCTGARRANRWIETFGASVALTTSKGGQDTFLGRQSLR